MLLDRGISHAPMVPGATPTPTQAARVGAPVPPDPGREAPGSVYAAPVGTPFFAAALYASQHGYAILRYVDASGPADYPVDAAAMNRYAHAAGTQAAVATVRASEPGGRFGAPFLGIGAQSVPPMGGSSASSLPNALRSSLIHDAGSGSVWATSPLHHGLAGGVAPTEDTAGGPEKGRKP